MAMGSKSKEDAQKNQAELTKALNNFLANKENLRPTVSDKASFDKLVKAVQDSTDANEKVGEFVTRVKQLGTVVEALAKTLGVLV